MTYFASKFERHHHRFTLVDANTGDNVCWCGMTADDVKATPKANKFNARKVTYKGSIYDSKKEASYAAELDLLIKGGKIKKWDRQFTIEVAPEGKPLFKMKVDFRVHALDGGYQLHEVKGWITERDPAYRLKRKAIELYWLPKHPDYTYHVIQ